MECFEKNFGNISISAASVIVLLGWAYVCFVKYLRISGVHHGFVGMIFVIKSFYFLTFCLCFFESEYSWTWYIGKVYFAVIFTLDGVMILSCFLLLGFGFGICDLNLNRSYEAITILITFIPAYSLRVLFFIFPMIVSAFFPIYFSFTYILLSYLTSSAQNYISNQFSEIYYKKLDILKSLRTIFYYYTIISSIYYSIFFVTMLFFYEVSYLKFIFDVVEFIILIRLAYTFRPYPESALSPIYSHDLTVPNLLQASALEDSINSPPFVSIALLPNSEYSINIAIPLFE